LRDFKRPAALPESRSDAAERETGNERQESSANLANLFHRAFPQTTEVEN